MTGDAHHGCCAESSPVLWSDSVVANSGRFLAALIQPIQAARLSLSISELQSCLSGSWLEKRIGVHQSFIESLPLQQPAQRGLWRHGTEATEMPGVSNAICSCRKGAADESPRKFLTPRPGDRQSLRVTQFGVARLRDDRRCCDHCDLYLPSN